MKPVSDLLKKIPLWSPILLMLLPTLSQGDPGSQYCVTPPFVSVGVQPNLLLLIDNSASMYDLAWSDTVNLYCANAPTTACTAGSSCPGTAYCLGAVTTTTTTSSSPKACTAETQCPNSTGTPTSTKLSCTANSQCPTYLVTGSASDNCNQGHCKSDYLLGPKCNAGFCNSCNTVTGAGDCVTTTVTSDPVTIRCDNQSTPDTYCNNQFNAINGTTGLGHDSCNNKCNATRQCYDSSYSAGTPYTGYFVAASTYSYDFTNARFTGGATMPGNCSYSASPELCVTTTGSGAAETATGFVASGNFLNWLSASKFDLEKQILTGGKFDTANSVLNAESRGCAGRKFLKAVPGVGLTFAIRGGTPGGVGTTQSQATEYGQTYIEIYAGSYNTSSCLSAMNDWMTLSSNPVNLGSFQNDTKACVGAGNGVLNGVSIWNHILHDCYNGIVNKAQGFSTNLGPLEGECQAIYATSLPPSTMTDPNAGYAVCSSALSYLDGSGNPQTGYLGKCWNGTDFSGPCTPNDLAQMANYCTMNVNTNPVVDPTSTGLQGAGQSAPGFILEQGLMNSFKVATLAVQVSLAAPPTGLIYSFRDRIRFGAMTFQNDGSGSECGGAGAIPCARACSVTTTRMCYLTSDCPVSAGVQETCGTVGKTDGGKIISYVGAGNCSATTAQACDVDADCSALSPGGQYCVASIGDHGTGLIKSIDAIPATSWTPFAEAFYNAMGYFARWNDPGYAASPAPSRSDSGFNALAAPNTGTSYLATKNPSQYRCQNNNIMLITDGMSTADRHATSEAFAAYSIAGTTYAPGRSGYDSANVYGATGSCPALSGSRSVADLAWVAKNRNIKTLSTSAPASSSAPVQPSEFISTYVVYSGSPSSGQPGLCDPFTLMTNTAVNGGTQLYSSSSLPLLLGQLEAAMGSVAAQVSSGTAASILSNSEGSGANILQAVFYPLKNFDNGTSVNWIGEMQNLWYYIDPLISKSSIREDTDGDLALNLINDYAVQFQFDANTGKTMVQLTQDTDGDGIGDVNSGGLIDPDALKSIWRAGRLLYTRDLSQSPRTIYTPYLSGGTQAGSTGMMMFSYGNIGATALPDNSEILQPYLQYPDDTAAAVKLMQYVHGFDFPGDTSMRSRTVKLGSIPAAAVSTVASDPYVVNPRDKGVGVWKLGDVISSTPRVQSAVQLGTYNLPAPGGYNDYSYLTFINSNQYKNRGMVYVGANDGMLHAFNFGLLSVRASGFQKASLSGSNLGSERWAFIPKNMLPYLKYSADPLYRHIYAIDGKTALVDASIGDTNSGTCVKAGYWNCDKLTDQSVVTGGNDLDPAKNSWRTILVGGMGIGGASAKTAGANSVATPISDPADSAKGLGYSSYFALDVTNPLSPVLLWEFNNPALGYSTTGPAIVRIGDSQKNGRWFAVFGSGPTGPINTVSNQFLGRSSQNLKFFVVDLRNGTLVKTIDTGIANAFAGSLLGGAIDADRWQPGGTGNYQDDAIYAGYVKQAEDGSWTDGGVGRILTQESSDPNDSARPWGWSTVLDGIGPVTTSIARLQDKKNSISGFSAAPAGSFTATVPDSMTTAAPASCSASRSPVTTRQTGRATTWTAAVSPAWQPGPW